MSSLGGAPDDGDVIRELDRIVGSLSRQTAIVVGVEGQPRSSSGNGHSNEGDVMASETISRGCNISPDDKLERDESM